MQAAADIQIFPGQAEWVSELQRLDRELCLQVWNLASYLASASDPDSDLLVAVSREGCEGYYLARSLGETGEILKIGVRGPSQRRGIGRALLEAGLRAGRKRGWKACFLEVRAGNREALALYSSLGFEAVGRRAAYYQDPIEDAAVLTLRLDDHRSRRAFS